MSIYGDKFKGYYLQEYIKVPCGKCVECCKQKVNQLISRMKIELDNHNGYGLFITLTYDEEHCPHSFVDYDSGEPLEYPVMTLCKEDVQKFLKRLRITLQRDGYDTTTFKYMYIGEYGMTNTDNKRPHYHMLVFFDVLAVNIFHDYVAKCWQLGNIKVDEVNESRMRYCANSHATANKLFPNAKGSLKPIAYWSKGFGLPLKKDLFDAIRRDGKVTISNNKYPIGRYLREKLFTRAEIVNRRKNVVSATPTKDDYLVKFLSASKRLFPRVRDVSDLTSEQCARVREYITQSENFKSDNYYKRYVLKRK